MAKWNPPMQTIIKGAMTWTATEVPGTEVTELEYQAESWLHVGQEAGGEQAALWLCRCSRSKNPLCTSSCPTPTKRLRMAVRCWSMRSAAALACGNVSTRRARWPPRKRTGAGFSPVANVAQLLFTFTSGGASLADAERLGQDRVLLHLLGLVKGADQTTLGEWLRAQTKESVMDLHRINAQLVDWASQQAKPGRRLHAGEAEVFFDDTEIEVEGYKFEGARICVPVGWLRWWRLFVDQWVPKRKPGRPAIEEVDST